MFDRLELLIGKDDLEKIKNKTVLIVGVGGVGGHVVTSLVRSGISNIIVIDFDIVDISNINRQVVAFHSTIGRKKVDVIKDMIKDINPDCKIDGVDVFLDHHNLESIFSNYKLDYVVDACDCVNTKKEIITYCLKNKIKFITSMGTGNKFDPSKLEVTDIRKTVNDPLARIFRKFVKDSSIKEKIMVLSSSELPVKTGNIVGSNAFVPGSAGLLISSYIIRNIINDKETIH